MKTDNPIKTELQSWESYNLSIHGSDRQLTIQDYKKRTKARLNLSKIRK